MGNTMAPRMCMCHKEKARTAAVTTTRGRRRPKSFGTVVPASAAPDAAPCKRRDDYVELEQQQQDETTTRAGPGTGRSRSRARDDDDAKAKQASAVVTVKIVLKRKDAEALVARLNAQSARERKARMDELKGELFGTGGCGVGGASPTRSPCPDAWKPSLAPIKEN